MQSKAIGFLYYLKILIIGDSYKYFRWHRGNIVHTMVNVTSNIFLSLYLVLFLVLMGIVIVSYGNSFYFISCHLSMSMLFDLVLRHLHKLIMLWTQV